jgi:hypothetical protein
MTEKMWNELFPHRYNLNKLNKKIPATDFYSFKALVKASEKFPAYLNEGDETTQKRELCAFLANMCQETSAGWDEAPGGFSKWAFYYIEEQGCENGCPHYTDATKINYPPVAGKSYHGRGRHKSVGTITTANSVRLILEIKILCCIIPNWCRKNRKLLLALLFGFG